MQRRFGRRSDWRRVSAGLLLALGFALVVGTIRAATFTASLDRDTIMLGESARLSLTFTEANPPAPSIPAVPNLQISYVGPSSQYSMINGQVSSSVSHVFSVVPRQEGEFTIPAMSIKLGSEVVSSPALKLKVVKPGAPSQESIDSGAQLAFMKLAVPKKQIYLGETVVGELQLYFNSRLSGRGNPQLTAFPADGFTLGKMAEGQQRQVQVGNAAYTMIPVAVPIRPIKTGPMTLGPVTASVVVELPGQNRRRDPFFDQFGFRDMFGRGGEQRQLMLATEAVEVQALPLPVENVPPEFSGAVGQFRLTVSAGPTNVGVGDPITVKVQIAGRGALENLSLPEQVAWHDFRTYPPTSKVESTDQLALEGMKTFEQVVVPEKADITQLPEFSFSYFDPEAKSYRVLKHPAMALVVRPAGSVALPTIAASQNRQTDQPPPVQDIVGIKQRFGTTAQVSAPLMTRPWFLALQGVPALAWLAVVGWRKRADQLARNPRLRRQRQVAQTVQRGLEELRGHATANRSDEFFALMFRLLQEQLGERLDLPATAITEAVIQERLGPARVEGKLVAELDALFQACNQARYAPVRSSTELAAIIPRLESALREVGGLKL
jgi:hypothetical protein